MGEFALYSETIKTEKKVVQVLFKEYIQISRGWTVYKVWTNSEYLN